MPFADDAGLRPGDPDHVPYGPPRRGAPDLLVEPDLEVLRSYLLERTRTPRDTSASRGTSPLRRPHDPLAPSTSSTADDPSDCQREARVVSDGG